MSAASEVAKDVKNCLWQQAAPNISEIKTYVGWVSFDAERCACRKRLYPGTRIFHQRTTESI